MTSLRTLQVFGLIALAAGIVLSVVSHRAPSRGWVGILLLLLAGSAWALIETSDNSRPSNLPMFLSFLFLAPIATVYSFRARRVAPDRMTATAAFAGSFVIGAALLFMVAGMVYSLVMI